MKKIIASLIALVIVCQAINANIYDLRVSDEDEIVYLSEDNKAFKDFCLKSRDYAVEVFEEFNKNAELEPPGPEDYSTRMDLLANSLINACEVLNTVQSQLKRDFEEYKKKSQVVSKFPNLANVHLEQVECTTTKKIELYISVCMPQ